MPTETLPTIEEVAANIKSASPTETASPEINVNKAQSSDGVEASTPKEEPAKKDPMAAKFAALARREKEARARAEDAERLASENARMRQEMDLRARQLEDRENAIKAAKRPNDVLKAHGLTYADVTADQLGSYEEKEPDPVDVKLSEKLTPIEQENAQLKTTLADMQRALAEIQTERAQIHQQRYIQEINEVAKSSGHDLIMAIGNEAYTLVQLVQQDFQQKHGKTLSLQEACDKVEEYYDKAVSRLAETPKIKSRLAPPAPTPAPAKQSPLKKEVSERPSTLTQSLTQGTRAKTVDLDRMPKHEALAYLATQLRFKD